MGRRTGRWIAAWTGLVVVLIYLPVLCGLLASLGKSRYFTFPIHQFSLDWWQRTADSLEIGILVHTSLLLAAWVTTIAVVLGFCGALAFARYDWRGRRLFQKLVLLPIFFPQPVLGLALLLWFNAIGVPMSWHTAIIAHLVWIVPVVTLVMAIQVYGFDAALEEAAFDLGASRLQVLREVTLPILWPGIWSGALFAFLLSWGNFPGSPAHCVLAGGQAACNTRWRRSLKPARPYIDRLIVLSRFTWPSTGLVVHGSSSAACTASISRRRPAAKLASGELSAAASTTANVSSLWRRRRSVSRTATAAVAASTGTSASSRCTKA
jgi:spermidine/putrescine transport system permease protein